MEAMLRGWWGCWRKARPVNVGSLLTEVANGTRAVVPTGLLRDWLSGYEWEGGHLEPHEAHRWRTTWLAEQERERASAEAPWRRGPRLGRTADADQYRIGRMVFTKMPPVTGVRDEEGRWQTDPARVDEVLWNSRAGIWAVAPPDNRAVGVLLDAYYYGRPALDAV